MNQDDKQELLDRLMVGAKEQCGGDPVALRLFEESTLEDLDAIEPLIDKMIERDLKNCIAIITQSMTADERLSVSRRLNERAGIHLQLPS